MKGKSEYNGMLIRPRTIEYFYQLCRYEKIDDRDSVLFVEARMHNGRKLRFTVWPLSPDSIQVELPNGRVSVYRRVTAPLIGKRLDLATLPEFLQKEWYATQGNHPLVFRVTADSVFYQGKGYRIEELLYVEDRLRKEYRLLAVAPDDEMLFYFKRWQTEGYVQIGFFGFYGALYKSDPDFPDQRCENVMSIIPAIKGVWYGTDGNDKEEMVIRNGTTLFEGEKISILRLTGRNPYRMTIRTAGGSLRKIILEKIDEEHLFLTENGRPRKLLKKDSASPDHLPVSLPEALQGEWIPVAGVKAPTIHLETDNSRILGKKVADPRFGLTSAGLAIYSPRGKKIATLTRYTSDHLEIVDRKGRSFLFKRPGVRGDSMTLAPAALPSELKGMWYGTEGKEYWAIEVTPSFLVADNAFWDYREILYRNGTYTMKVASGPLFRTYTFRLRETPYCEVSRNKRPVRLFACDPSVVVRKAVNRSKSRKPNEAFLQGYLAGEGNGSPVTLNIRYTSIALDDYITRSAHVDSLGRFSFTLPMAYGTNVFLEKQGHYMELFLVPGDSTLVRIDGEQMHFMGDDADACYDLLDLRKREYATMKNMNAYYQNDTFSVFRDFARKKAAEWNTQTHDYLVSHPVSENFRKWCNDRARYNFPYLMLDYCIIHPLYKGQDVKEWLNTIPDGEMDFLDDYPVDLDREIVSDRFTNYLHNLVLYYDIKRPRKALDLTFTYKDVMSTLERAGVEIPADLRNWVAAHDSVETQADTLFVKRIIALTNEHPAIAGALVMLRDAEHAFGKYERPELYQVYLSNVLGSALNREDTLTLQQLMGVYMPEITEPRLRSDLLAVYEQVMEEARNPLRIDNTLLSETGATGGDSLLVQIVDKHKGKVIYIDFWATWCGPCRGEMPASKKIREHFKGKDVVFVYLCSSSSGKGSWKRMVREMEIEGDNYFVEEPAWSDLTGRFGITGIPHYILIDRKGRVVDSHAPRPSQQDLLIPAIEKLLEDPLEK